MIIEYILEAGLLFQKVIFDILPDVPQISTQLINSISHVLDIIFSNLSLLGIFVRIDTIKILVPLVIFVVNFEYLYNIIIWILRKIPGLSIS